LLHYIVKHLCFKNCRNEELSKANSHARLNLSKGFVMQHRNDTAML